MQSIGLLFLRMIVRLFSILPFGVIYWLADALSFLLNRVFGYRKKVILQNLTRSFPEKSEDEIKLLAKKFYRHFSDILVESIKGLSLSKAALQRRFVYTNSEIFDQHFKKNESVIILGSHYGNWEWGVLSFPLAVRHKVIGSYKPIKNKSVDEYLNRLRRQWGLHLTSMAQTGRAIVQNRDKPCAFVLIADQTPVDVKNAHWLEFLNQDTPFLHGGEKLAKTTKYPTYLFDIQRVNRGFYEVTFHQITDRPTDFSPGMITQEFATHLEKTIQRQPENWLWSHRRWKRKRPPTN